MIEMLAIAAAAYGAHLLYTAVMMGWRGLGPGPRAHRAHRLGPRLQQWLAQAGLGEVTPRDVVAAIALLFGLGVAVGYVLFAAALPALLVGVLGAGVPPATYRRRRATRLAAAHEAWPHLIEQIRVLVGSVGRSIPQALFETGERGPHELQPAFAAAHREWLLTTDFPRTISVLKQQLADPTADAACETLLVAHALGGADLDHRLAALADDRRQELDHRKDARARQAGVRFARSFVLVVPLGMACTGLAIGDGRAAYQRPFGQVVVCAALAMVAACWCWAGLVMRLPEPERVLDR